MRSLLCFTSWGFRGLGFRGLGFRGLGNEALYYIGYGNYIGSMLPYSLLRTSNLGLGSTRYKP